jgi:N-acylglucosamine 2-epimerase
MDVKNFIILKVSIKLKIDNIIEKASKILLNTLDFGWDKEYSGFFYFMDIKGNLLYKV